VRDLFLQAICFEPHEEHTLTLHSCAAAVDFRNTGANGETACSRARLRSEPRVPASGRCGIRD
jgi:hypothetical protein